MQRHAPEEWTDYDDIREAGEARYQRQQLDFRVEAWLRREGWKHTSDTPGCFWMWQRALPDGRVVLVDRAMAISLTEHWPEGLPADAGTGAVTSGEAGTEPPPSWARDHRQDARLAVHAGFKETPVGAPSCAEVPNSLHPATSHSYLCDAMTDVVVKSVEQATFVQYRRNAELVAALTKAERAQADAIKAAVASERERLDRALELLHRYVDGLPPQKPTSIDGDTQAFLAEVDSGADAPGAVKGGGK